MAANNQKPAAEGKPIETVLLTSIVSPQRSKAFEEFFARQRTPLLFWAQGVGTAPNEMLDYLGIGESDKDIIFTLLSKQRAHRVLRSMDKRMQLYIPGNGIAFAVPLSSFAGLAALEYASGEYEDQLRGTANENSKQEDDTMTEPGQYQLVIAITNRGFVEEVMDAARAASARGGTVIHALGTGSKHAEQFFGISIAPEKDMIFIVTTTAAKDDIMKAIIATMGKINKTHAIVFSLPITDIAGLRMVVDEDDEDEDDSAAAN